MERDRESVIVAFGRSAVTRGGKGELARVHPIEFAGQVMAGVLAKIPRLDGAEIDDVVYGCTNLTGYQSYDVTKMIAARAGLPATVSAITVSRFCASGSDAVAIAKAKIESGMADVIVAGGVESMSLVPQPTPETRMDYHWLEEHVDPDIYLHVGLCAENTARRGGITRTDVDALAVQSHQRAADAQDAGKFDDQIIPVKLLDEEGRPFLLTKDSTIRRGTSMEKLAGLKPVFDPDGIVTAGTSSQVSDGTSCLVLMSRKKARALGLSPIARMVGYAPGCGAPGRLSDGVVEAIDKVMGRTGLTVEQMDTVEINEAFAPVVIDLVHHYGLDWEKVNPCGSAMALGHPLGATGGVLAIKALSELRRIGGRYALVAMCAAIGHGGAAIYELLDK